MNARRWPALVLIPALLAGAALVDRRDREAPASEDIARLEDRGGLAPVVPPEEFGEATWYCAGGTAEVDSRADHSLLLLNGGEQEAQLTITAYPEGGVPVVQRSRIAAGEKQKVRVGDIVSARWAAALVEADRGALVVEHEIVGPQGQSIQPCHSAASDTWFTAGGTLESDARFALALFNPFPDSAVVDITFATEEGTREENFQGLVVPGASLVVLDELQDQLPRGRVAAADIRARTGRLVVDRVQWFTGERNGPRGLALAPAVPRPAPVWSFPDSARLDAEPGWFSVFNPGDEPAEVDVEIRPAADSGFAADAVEPFELDVAPGTWELVDLAAAGQERVPVGMNFTARAVSLNGVPIVVERVIQGSAGSARPGLTVVNGSPIAALEQYAVVGAVLPDEADYAETLVIVNPGSALARVTLTRFTEDGERVELVEAGPVEVDAGARVELDLANLDLASSGVSGPLPLHIVSSAPVVVERRVVIQGRASSSLLPAVAGTVQRLRQ